MTSFLELARTRQSDRAYDAHRAVEEDKLNRILEAGHLAPSACNAQPWRFVVVTNAELKNKIADATASHVLMMNHFTKQAPVHIVIVEESPNFTSSVGSMIKHTPFSQIDVGIAAAHIALAAADEGLGTCILGWFDEKKVKALLKIPSGKKVSLIITLGYSQQPTREKKRKAIGDVVRYNAYTN